MRFKIPFIVTGGQESGHSEQLTTDHELETGGAPFMIDRIQSLQRGKIGPNVNSFPMTAGMQYVGHVPLVQLRRGPTLTPGNAVDDRAIVPAVFAGNPIE